MSKDKVGLAESDKIQNSRIPELVKNGKFFRVRRIECHTSDLGIHAFYPYFSEYEETQISKSDCYSNEFFKNDLKKVKGLKGYVKHEIELKGHEFIVSIVASFIETTKHIISLKIRTNLTTYIFGDKAEFNKRNLHKIEKDDHFIPGWKSTYVREEGIPYLNFLKVYYEDTDSNTLKNYITLARKSWITKFIRRKTKQVTFISSLLFKIFVYLSLIISPFLLYYHASQNIYGGEYIIRDGKLNSPVKIFTDENGFSHIKANSKEDGFFALGFVHAKERLWQMDFMRRINNGRLSEVVGEKALAIDKMMRKLGLKNFVEKNEIVVKNSRYFHLIEKYIQGINYYALNNVLPIEYYLLRAEFDTWELTDTIAVGCFFSWVNTHDWRIEVWYKIIEEHLGKDFADIVVSFRDSGHKFENESIINEEELTELNLSYKNNRKSEETVNTSDLKENSKGSKHETNEKKTDESDEVKIHNNIENTNDSENKINKSKENISHTQQNYVKKDNVRIETKTLKKSKERSSKPKNKYHGEASFDPNNANFKMHNEPASNNWVISGQHTVSGKPIFTNDPHVDNTIPSSFYLAKLYLPDNILTGSTIPGVPFFAMGTNNHLAWGITTDSTETTDLCEEKIEGDFYIYDGKKFKLEKTIERIYIKGQAPLELEINWTHNGPIIDSILNDSLELGTDYKHYTPLSIRIYWTKHEFKSTDFYFDVMFGKSKDNFLSEAKNFSTPNLNFVFSSISGDIGYIPLGFIPIKKTIRKGFCHGYSSEDDILGHVSREDTPQLINPKKGFIVTANNKIASKTYKYNFPGFHNNVRAYRARELIENKIKTGKIGVKDNIEMLKDIKDSYAENLLPKILTILERNQRTHLPFYNELKSWDFKMIKDSPIPTIYSVLEYSLGKYIMSGQNMNIQKINGVLSVLHFWNFLEGFINKVISNRRYELQRCANLTGNSNCENYVLSIFSILDTELEHFKDKKGRILNWGEVKSNEYKHIPFGSVPYLNYIFTRSVSTDGNRNTIKLSRGTLNHSTYPNSIFKSNHSASLKLVADLADINKPYIIVDVGNSGKIFSKYFDNFLEKSEKVDLIQFEDHKFSDENSPSKDTILLSTGV